jgi:hypothetical protein
MGRAVQVNSGLASLMGVIFATHGTQLADYHAIVSCKAHQCESRGLFVDVQDDGPRLVANRGFVVEQYDETFRASRGARRPRFHGAVPTEYSACTKLILQPAWLVSEVLRYP